MNSIGIRHQGRNNVTMDSNNLNQSSMLPAATELGTNMSNIMATLGVTFDLNTISMTTTDVDRDDDLPIPHPVERGFEAVLLFVIFVIALLGNLLLWVVVIRHRSLRTESNALVLCLSAADILVAVASMPVTIGTIVEGRWPLNNKVCIALGFVSMCTFIGSVMSLAAISINRYILIVHPSKFKRVYTRRNTGFFIIGVWVLAAILSLPPLTGGWGMYGFLPNQSFCFCRWRTSISYTFFMVGVCFGGPCSVMTFCYINILRAVRLSRKRVASRITPPSKPSQTALHRAKSNPESCTPSKKQRVPAISLNDNVYNSSSESLNLNTTRNGVANGNAQGNKTNSHSKELLRSQLNDLIRAQTIAMANNELTQSIGQLDVSASNSPAQVQGVVRPQSLLVVECTSTTPLRPAKPSQRELKWEIQGQLPGSIMVSAGDRNSNNVNQVHRDRSQSVVVIKSPNRERSPSLRRTTLDVPIPAVDLARRKQRKKNRSESERRRKEEELKLTKSFLVVIFVFVACWFPFCITMFWSVFSDRDNAVPRPVDIGTLLLGYLNSCCNPIIYGVMNKRFRAGYKSVLCGWRRRKGVDSLNMSNNDILNSGGVLPGNSTLASTASAT